jgi:hypothetical protein
MKQSKPLVTDVVSMRASEYSNDGKNVTISLTTKYSSERLFSVPLACLQEFITDLETLKSSAAQSGAKTEKRAGKEPAAQGVIRATPPGAKSTDVKVTVPKKWMLASGLPQHPLVILILDPQTDAQAGFGFTDRAAREMATGLVKYADAIAQQAKPKGPLS